MGRETLSQEEIACLMQDDSSNQHQAGDQASTLGSKAESDGIVTTPDAPSKSEQERVTKLRALAEHLAYNLSEALSESFRAPTNVTVGDIDDASFGEFVLCLDDPTCFVTLCTKDERATFVLNIELSILFPMIERMLGGDLGAASVEPRSLTEIERRLAIRIVELFLDEWKTVCKQANSLEPETMTVDSSPCRAEALACKEAVMHTRFEVSLGQACGAISLVMPRSVADKCEPLDGEASSYRASSRDGRSEDPVHVSVVLAETKLPAVDVNDLQVGDVIDIEKGTDDALDVTVDGEPRFKGKAGILDDHKAVRIEEGSVRETQ